MDITITLDDEKYKKIKKKADSFNITPEELICVNIDDFLSRSDEEFLNAVDYVLNKNSDLYKRLA
jgi:hypothetical protein